jgi:hypothetical protein
MFSDVAGNCIRIGRKLDKQDVETGNAAITAASDRLALALDFAYKSEDEDDELEKVSKVLDKAIERDQHHHCHNLYKVMILRADMAVAQENPDKAKALLEQVCSSPDVVRNPDKYKTELQRVEDIRRKMK